MRRMVVSVCVLCAVLPPGCVHGGADFSQDLISGGTADAAPQAFLGGGKGGSGVSASGIGSVYSLPGQMAANPCLIAPRSNSSTARDLAGGLLLSLVTASLEAAFSLTLTAARPLV